MAGVRAAHNHHDPDGILVDKRNGVGRVHDKICLCVHGNETSLDIPISFDAPSTFGRMRKAKLDIPRELLQRDLRVGAEDDVRVEIILPLVLSLLLPALLHGKPAEHDGLGGAGRRSSDRVSSRASRRLPQISDCRFMSARSQWS